MLSNHLRQAVAFLLFVTFIPTFSSYAGDESETLAKQRKIAFSRMDKELKAKALEILNGRAPIAFTPITFVVRYNSEFDFTRTQPIIRDATNLVDVDHIRRPDGLTGQLLVADLNTLVEIGSEDGIQELRFSPKLENLPKYAVDDYDSMHELLEQDAHKVFEEQVVARGIDYASLHATGKIRREDPRYKYKITGYEFRRVPEFDTEKERWFQVRIYFDEKETVGSPFRKAADKLLVRSIPTKNLKKKTDKKNQVVQKILALQERRQNVPPELLNELDKLRSQIKSLKSKCEVAFLPPEPSYFEYHSVISPVSKRWKSHKINGLGVTGNLFTD